MGKRGLSLIGNSTTEETTSKSCLRDFEIQAGGALVQESMKENFSDEQIAMSLMGSCTKSALLAASCGVYFARARNERVHSIHFLYGILSDEMESIAATILNLNNCSAIKIKKALVELPKVFERPFLNSIDPCAVSQELQDIIERSTLLSQRLRFEIDTAHILEFLYQAGDSREFLQKTTPIESVQKDLAKFRASRDADPGF